MEIRQLPNDELAARRALRERYECPDCGSRRFEASIRLDDVGKLAEFVDVVCCGCATPLEILEDDGEQ